MNVTESTFCKTILIIVVPIIFINAELDFTNIISKNIQHREFVRNVPVNGFKIL